MRLGIHILDRVPRTVVAAASILFLVAVAAVDFATAADLEVSYFYAVPVFLGAWRLGRSWAMAFSAVSAVAWLTCYLLQHPSPSHPAVPYWNALLELAFFLTLAFLFSELRDVLRHQEELASTDALTGIANRRTFITRVAQERERATRSGRPLTVAICDLDSFKAVNDSSGHAEGDKVLRGVASTLKDGLRTTDLASRLGGDEFGVLLPETSADAALSVLKKLRESLRGTMAEGGWPVTFSIGAVTFQPPVPTASDLLRRVDAEMYAVKGDGKDAIRHLEEGNGSRPPVVSRA